jgi:Na+/H+-dicarboxylate symporter
MFLKAQRFSLILLLAILLGSLLGWIFKQRAEAVKPLGDLLLNALFMTVVPLVFFSISSAVAAMASTARLFKILGWMLLVFAATGLVAAAIMLTAVELYPPAKGVCLPVEPKEQIEQVSAGQQIVNTLSVPDFVDLLSKRNMLALIIFAVLVGLATSAVGEKGKAFAAFLQAGNSVFMKIISFVMLYAPIGLAAYFAYLVGVHGPKLLSDYLRAMVLYYPICIGYFFIAFTAYAYLAARGKGVRAFWKNIPPAALTAAGTSSSFATIPVNLSAANRVGVPADISEVVIPIGATIHMDGSVLSAILKIAFLFGLYNMPFTGIQTFATAAGVALLSGMVMSGIPGGGFTGEMLIVTMYGFPPEALPIIMMIGTLVDPPATMVNAVGDNVASMMIARIMGGKDWLKRSANP